MTTQGTTAGALFDLVRSGRAVTRSELGSRTGLSRTAVSARIEALLATGLLTAGEQVTTTGGRPSESLRVDRTAGVVLAIAIGRSRHQVGVHDLTGLELAAADADHEAGLDAASLMPRVVELAGELLERTGHADRLIGVGMSLPGTVDPAALTSVGSPVIPGWDDVPLRPLLAPLGEVPIWLGNDADVLAHAELLGRPDLRDAIVLKASTGIGVGVLAAGRIVSGAAGAAGELGHCRTPAADDRLCRCGARGCLEAVAGGWALVADWQAAGHPSPVSHVRDLAALARTGDAAARDAVRTAGRRIGEVLSVAVTLLNPEAVIVGGDLAAAYDPLVGGLQETLYPRTTTLAARDLRLLPSVHGERAGLVGSAALALDHALGVESIDALLRARPALSVAER